MIIVPYLLGCLAAMANGATNLMQRAANREESPRLQFSFRLINNLLHKRLWLASVGTMISSFILQAAGLPPPWPYGARRHGGPEPVSTTTPGR